MHERFRRKMARTCGVDLDNKDARIVVLDGSSTNFMVVDTPFKRIALHDSQNQAAIKSFVDTLQAFFNDLNVDSIAIKSRALKGRGRGGALTFKLEGLIQSMKQPVILISPQTIASRLKRDNIDISEANVLVYQREAYSVAYLALPL